MKKLTWKRSDCVWIIWFEVIISWARYRCYFRWDFLQGKEGEGKNPPPALLFTLSPLLQWHRQLQISPVLQPHGKWIQRAEQPQLLLSRTAVREAAASSWTHPRHRPRGSTLPNARLCPELHRKHLGKLHRHHLAKGWQHQQCGVTHGSAKQGSNWSKAAGGAAMRGCGSYTTGCSDCFSQSFISPFLLHSTQAVRPAGPPEFLLESSVPI